MNSDIPSFTRFDHDDAWAVGSVLVERCRAAKLPVVVVIHLGRQRVFHVAVPGSSASLDTFADRKAGIVWQFGESSMAVAEKYVRDGDWKGFLEAFGLSPVDYFPSGGAVPILVGGSIVGVLALSGVDSATEHTMAVTALREHAEEASR